MENNLLKLSEELSLQYKKLEKFFIEYDGYEDVDYNLSMSNLVNDLKIFVDDHYMTMFRHNVFILDALELVEDFKQELLPLTFRFYKVMFETRKVFGTTIFENICVALTELYFYATFPDKINDNTACEIDYAPFVWSTYQEVVELYNKRFDPLRIVDIHDEDCEITLEDLAKLDSLLKNHVEVMNVLNQAEDDGSSEYFDDEEYDEDYGDDYE